MSTTYPTQNQIDLLRVLADSHNGLTPVTMRSLLNVSAKSVHWTLTLVERHGLAKLDGDRYVLTSRGRTMLARMDEDDSPARERAKVGEVAPEQLVHYAAPRHMCGGFGYILQGEDRVPCECARMNLTERHGVTERNGRLYWPQQRAA